ncbi:MAG: alpha/beta hydrolase [Dehalococcoidia bacterium]
MVTQRHINVRHGLFNIDLREDGTGDPLLYLHNMAIQSGWDPFLARLAEHFHVIAPIHPGFGASTGIEYIDDPIDMVVFYNDFLDAIGVESAHVIGHELGGMFAAELAALSPERVKKLVLVAPYGLWLEGQEAPDRFATPSSMLRELIWHNPDSEMAKTYMVISREPDEVVESTVQRTRALSAGSRFLWPFPERGLHKRIHRIKAATLLVWGESDRLVPPLYAKAFEAAIPQADLVTISAAGHMVPLEQPDTFAKTVTKFLEA